MTASTKRPNSTDKLGVFAGSTSQTGIAAKARGYDFSDDDKSSSFEEAKDLLILSKAPQILPAWNTYCGEIDESAALDLVFCGKATIFDLWSKPIQFCYGGSAIKKEPKVFGVFAAEKQCSIFLSNNQLPFSKQDNSPKAKSSYENSERKGEYAGVLLPSLTGLSCDERLDNIQNGNNLTTFLGLQKPSMPQTGEPDQEKTVKYVVAKLVFDNDEIRPGFVENYRGLCKQARSIREWPQILFACERPSADPMAVREFLVLIQISHKTTMDDDEVLSGYSEDESEFYEAYENDDLSQAYEARLAGASPLDSSDHILSNLESIPCDSAVQISASAFVRSNDGHDYNIEPTTIAVPRLSLATQASDKQLCRALVCLVSETIFEFKDDVAMEAEQEEFIAANYNADIPSAVAKMMSNCRELELEVDCTQ